MWSFWKQGRSINPWELLTLHPCSTFKPSVPSTLLVLLVTLGWSSRAFLLIDTHVHSAVQASAATHMFEHPGPEVCEAAVL